MIPKTKALLILKIILAIMLPVLLFLATTNYYIFNEGYYKGQFGKRQVYASVEAAALKNILDYYNGKAALNQSLFTTAESSHLADVKKLIDGSKMMFVIAAVLVVLFIILIFLLSGPEFLKNLKSSAVTALAISIVATLLFVLLLISFSSSFFSFHKLFFPQGNFLFSESSILIQMFPESFFMETFFRIALLTAAGMAVIFVLLSSAAKLTMRKGGAK